MGRKQFFFWEDSGGCTGAEYLLWRECLVFSHLCTCRPQALTGVWMHRPTCVDSYLQSVLEYSAPNTGNGILMHILYKKRKDTGQHFPVGITQAAKNTSSICSFCCSCARVSTKVAIILSISVLDATLGSKPDVICVSNGSGHSGRDKSDNFAFGQRLICFAGSGRSRTKRRGRA